MERGERVEMEGERGREIERVVGREMERERERRGGREGEQQSNSVVSLVPPAPLSLFLPSLHTGVACMWMCVGLAEGASHNIMHREWNLAIYLLGPCVSQIYISVGRVLFQMFRQLEG